MIHGILILLASISVAFNQQGLHQHGRYCVDVVMNDGSVQQYDCR